MISDPASTTDPKAEAAEPDAPIPYSLTPRAEACLDGLQADPEPDAETVGTAWHPAYYDARDAGHSPDTAEAIANQAEPEAEARL